MKNLARTMTAALAAVALIGCGDSPSEQGSDYEFRLAVSGAVSETLEGTAYFGADTGEDEEPIFALLLMTDDEEKMVIMAKRGADRPGTGSYSFAADPQGGEWQAMLTSTDDEELLGFFIAESGTLTITESTSTRMRGTITFQAEGFLGDDFETPAQVTVTGQFEARRAPAGGLLRMN